MPPPAKDKKNKKLWQERSGKTVMGDYQEKHNNKGELLCKLKSLPSSLIRVSRGLDVPSSWYTEGDTQMQLSLVNTNVSFKSITSTWFSELCPYLFFGFFFNNQLRIMPMPKRHIGGGGCI